MELSLQLILQFGAVVAATHFLQAATGFGCTVLAMPFCSLLAGVDVAKPVLTLYSLLLSLFIAVRGWRQIDWRHFRHMMLLLVLGMPFGVLLYSRLPQQALMKALAVFMIAVSAHGLLAAFGLIKKTRLSRGVTDLLMLLGGMVHGAFSSGGPLAVVYAAQNLPGKAAFRSTLSLIWVSLNTLLLIQMAISGQWSGRISLLSAACLPFLAVGMVLGDRLHGRCNEAVFHRMTYTVLLLTGIFILL